MNNEVTIRLSFFFGMLVLITIWEFVSPRRKLNHSKTKRWVSNLGITITNSMFVRLIFPVMAVGMAVVAKDIGWGLLNSFSLPLFWSVFCSVVILDLIIYLQHLMFHAVPVIWKVHMMHHADMDYDVTTGLRFHPIEIILSMVIKLAAISVLGAPVVAVIIFEILLNATAMFNHGNIRLAPKIDKYLRLLLVTPDMHRVHHSVIINETNSNFGFNLPWWDRLLGTYREQPFHGHDNMTIGLSQIRDFKKTVFLRMLGLPFVEKPGTYSITQKGKEPKGQQ